MPLPCTDENDQVRHKPQAAWKNSDVMMLPTSCNPMALKVAQEVT